MQWLRLYDDVLDDPKVQRLPSELFKHWINLLCLANKSEVRGTLPDEADIAFRLRLSIDQLDDVLVQLNDAGLLETTDDDEPRWIMHAWEKRQPSPAEIAAIHEARVRAGRLGGLAKASKNVAPAKQTSSNTDTDTDTEIEIEIENRVVEGVRGDFGADAPRKPKTKRATSMTDDWMPDVAAWNAMLAEDFTQADIKTEIVKFRDHFKANGKPMKDWSAAWRNWMRRSREFGPARASPNGSNGLKPEERRPAIPMFQGVERKQMSPEKLEQVRREVELRRAT